VRGKKQCVVLVSEHYPPQHKGGAELSAERLAHGLTLSGLAVTVVTVNIKSGAFLHETRKGVEVFVIPFFFHFLSPKWQQILFRSFLFYAYLSIVLMWIAAARRPIALHAQNKHTLIPTFVAGKSLRIPVTFTVRDPMLLCQSGFCFAGATPEHEFALRATLRCLSTLNEIYTGFSHLRFLQRFWGGLVFVDTIIKRHVLMRCQGVIFVSNAMQAMFRKGGLDHPVQDVIYNLPPDLTGQANGHPDIIRKLAAFKEEGGRIVLTVGKLSYGKGTRFVLDSIPLVMDHVPRVRFVFAGRIEPGFALETTPPDHALFTGFLPTATIAKLYKLADVVCQPSVWPEPLSRTLLEAMAFGKAVVATAVGGTPEIVVDGVTGILVPSRNSSALANAITSLLLDRSASMRLGEQGREKLLRTLKPEELVKRHLDHYQRLKT